MPKAGSRPWILRKLAKKLNVLTDQPVGLKLVSMDLQPIISQVPESRLKILQAAQEAIHQCSFEKTSLNSILKASKLSKGAFYHHFPSKKDLGLALITELFEPFVQERWVIPLKKVEDPLGYFPEFLKAMGDSLDQDTLRCGCPLNNLAQELSNTDEDFRMAFHGVYERWINGYELIFTQAQTNGQMIQTLSPRSVASFIVSCIQGTVGLTKTAGDHRVMESNSAALFYFLQTLKPKR